MKYLFTFALVDYFQEDISFISEEAYHSAARRLEFEGLRESDKLKIILKKLEIFPDKSIYTFNVMESNV